MAYVSLPCDSEYWWDYQKMFILLSHLRSIKELELLISSHTRPDERTDPSFKSLAALKGFEVFLKDYCTAEQQKRIVTHTLPFIAKAAAMLEDRVPPSGIPCLEKQENSALVLGRKIILSIISNAFLCTFPLDDELGGNSFSFERLYQTFLGKDTAKKSMQAAKLHCMLCYFERAASGKCNLSAVITYRRQVLSKRDLPRILEWESNSIPLCPFAVDSINVVEESGGHTLQVCSTSSGFGGGILEEGCGNEEIRFCMCPELLIGRLVMAEVENNEAILVTGTERFCSYSASGANFTFTGEFIDESERDVFGNLLNSFLAIDFEPFPKPPTTPAAKKMGGAPAQDDPQAQYRLDRILRELNKAYVGFYCQQDRGDISTELLALTVKRGSLAFVAEDYPECGGTLNVTSRQSDLGNVQLSSNEGWNQAGSSSKVTAPPVVIMDPKGGTNPLSPIPEGFESPSFSGFLADGIIKSGLEQVTKGKPPTEKKNEKVVTGEEKTASKVIGSLFGTSVTGSRSGEAIKELRGIMGDHRPYTMDELAQSLTSSIVTDTITSAAPKPNIVVVSESSANLEARSDSIALNIISDVLASEEVSPAPPPLAVAPQSVGEASVGSSPSDEILSNMAVEVSGNILSGVIKDCGEKASCNKPRKKEEEVPPGGEELMEFVNDLANEAIRNGIASAESFSTESSSIPSSLDVLASSIAQESINSGVQGGTALELKQPRSFKKQGSGDPLGDSDSMDIRSTGGGLNLNSRLLTPVSTRTGYAWSIASTRDEDSRPVSPTDLNNIGLSLSNNTEEFSSLFSNILISTAISNVTGKSLSPTAISTDNKEDVSLPRTTKIGLFLSTLNEAEPPSDGGLTPPYNNMWQNMRRQLLRPIATGFHQEGCGKGGKGKGDPQLRAIIQWMAASASARPRLFYYSQKEESVKQLSEVTTHLRSKLCTVGDLCQKLVGYSKLSAEERERRTLFSFLLGK